jgi:Domain of unknown function (DUF5597)
VRQIDSRDHTVIMIQVQNEVGLLGDSRDRCPSAVKAFGQQVPPELTDYLIRHKETLLPEFRKTWEAAGFKSSGTWQEVFGTGVAADETFMAWNYARYLDRIAAAGKAEYALPMFINTWIVQPEDKGPGDYPSGGAVAHLHDVWQAGAPSIDILAPDIYLPDFPGILASYSRNGNPVFIPESRAGARGAANAFYAFGQGRAMGYSPFGIEDRELVDGPMPQAYAVLSQLSPLILQGQQKNTIAGFWLNLEKPSQSVSLGNYTLTAELRKTRHSTVLPELGYALAIVTGQDEFVVAGCDVQITFSTNPASADIVGLSCVEEGTFVDGKWTPGRRLNGDEVQLRYELSEATAVNQSGAGLRFGTGAPTIQRVTLYRYR